MVRIFSENDWALILGGSSGFGLATARKLAAHGMNLCIVHRDRRAALPAIEAAFGQLRAGGVALRSFNCDATSAEQRQVIAQELEDALLPDGRVRLLMHSIAFGNLRPLAGPSNHNGSAPPPGGPHPLVDLASGLQISTGCLAEVVEALSEPEVGTPGASTRPGRPRLEAPLTEDDFAHTIHAMGTSLIAWVQELLQRGLFADDARVVGMTSEGSTVAWEGYAAVSAAKAVLESTSRSLAVELARRGLRSNVVQAGITDTPALRHIPGHEQLKASALTRNPFRRLTTPEDVANVVYLLCLQEAAWINGALIRVDGGEHVAGV